MGGGRGPSSRPSPGQQGPGFLPRHGRQRVFIRRLVKSRDVAGGGRHQIDETRKGVAEKPGYPQRHIDPRPVENIERQNLETGNPAGSAVPSWLRSHQGQDLRDVVAARPHVGGTQAVTTIALGQSPLSCAKRSTSGADLSGVQAAGSASLYRRKRNCARRQGVRPSPRRRRRGRRHNRRPNLEAVPAFPRSPQDRPRGESWFQFVRERASRAASIRLAATCRKSNRWPEVQRSTVSPAVRQGSERTPRLRFFPDQGSAMAASRDRSRPAGRDHP